MTSLAPSPALPQTDKNNTTAEQSQSYINKLTDCHFYLTSFCKNGSSCEFRHNEDAKSMFKVCKYWLNDECDNVHCMFRHPTKPPKIVKADPSKTPCYFFFEGGGCAKGTACQFLHTKPGATASESKKTLTTAASTVETAPRTAAQTTKQTPKTQIAAKSETKAPSKPEVTSSQKKNNNEKPQEKKPAATVKESPKKNEQKTEPKKEGKKKKINREILPISLDGDEFSSVVFTSSSLAKRPREEAEPAKKPETASPAKKQRVDPPATKPAVPAPKETKAPAKTQPSPAPTTKPESVPAALSKPSPKPTPAAVVTPVSKPATTTANTTKPKPSTSTNSSTTKSSTPEKPKPSSKPAPASEDNALAELEELEAFLAEN